MKKSIFTLTTLLFLLVSTSTIKAQDEWIHGKKGIYSVGIGGTQAIAFGSLGTGGITGVGLSVNVAGEYKVWNWIGLGWQTGINYYPRFGISAIGIPFAAKANVHIMDAANVSIANKLDVYAGLNLGFGVAFYTQDVAPVSAVFGFMQIGPQVGARYWVSDKIGVFGEFGWGATFANVGVTF